MDKNHIFTVVLFIWGWIVTFVVSGNTASLKIRYSFNYWLRGGTPMIIIAQLQHLLWNRLHTIGTISFLIYNMWKVKKRNLQITWLLKKILQGCLAVDCLVAVVKCFCLKPAIQANSLMTQLTSKKVWPLRSLDRQPNTAYRASWNRLTNT